MSEFSNFLLTFEQHAKHKKYPTTMIIHHHTFFQYNSWKNSMALIMEWKGFVFSVLFVIVNKTCSILHRQNWHKRFNREHNRRNYVNSKNGTPYLIIIILLRWCRFNGNDMSLFSVRSNRTILVLRHFCAKY